jgi:hypothetical protein
MTDFLFWFTIITTGIQTLAAAVAIIAAFVGFSAWRKQLRTTEDHNLARELLIAAISLRDAITAARTNIMVLPEQEQKWEKDWYRRQEREEFGHRIKEVTARRNALEAKIIEAQAIWDEPVDYWFVHLISRHSAMVVDVDTYFELTDPRRGALSVGMAKNLEDARNSLFCRQGPKDDKIDSELNAALDSIREKLKARMIKR